MKIAIIVALQTEFDLVKNIFTSYKEFDEKNIKFFKGEISNHEVALMKCGIGKVNAAVGIAELFHVFSPDLVINTGVAGGIDQSVEVGDIIIGEQCCYHDVWCGEDAWGQVQGLPLYFAGNRKIIDIIKSISVDNTHLGLICTGDQFITEDTGFKEIKRNFPKALAVDMESAAMAHVCYQRNMPFVSIRVISDTPHKATDNHTQYFDFWETAPRLTFDVLRQVLEKL